ncbi:MAG: hypothetical protein NOU37_08295 [Candidatus Brocadiales bacterium]|nr:hypothetical protein [Candidatus Bathyanammoxibius amoris]
MRGAGKIWPIACCLTLAMALVLCTFDYVWAPVKYRLDTGDVIDFTAVTKANQGTGSGLDADLLDGMQGSEYLASSGSLDNTFTIGDANDTDKYYKFDKGGSNLPGLRWNAQGGKVQVSHDGTSYQDLGGNPVTEEGDTQKVANTATLDFDASDFIVTESPTNEANVSLEDTVKFSGKTTDDLSEGSTNLYHTDTRFDTRFGTKTTDDLSEGTTNKYNPFGMGIDSSEITDGTVTDTEVSGTAAIVESKLNLNYATHSNANDPASDEKAALAGTSGTPSGTNKYVTDSDSRMTDSRTPTTHGSGAHDSTVEATANKDAASGYAGLDGSSKLTGSQLPYGTSANTACEGNDSRLPAADAVIKGWVKFDDTGTAAILDSYNVSSVTDNGTGIVTVNWDTNFANAHYGVAAIAGLSGASAAIASATLSDWAVGSVQIRTFNDAGTATDMDVVGVIAIGDQ